MRKQNHTLDLIFSIVDDFCKKHLKKRKGKRKRGAPYRYSDRQIFKMVAIKYLLGISSDRSLIRILKGDLVRKLFRSMPDHSQFNRRVKQLLPEMINFQKHLTAKLKCPLDDIRLIDSTSIPVIKYARSGRTSLYPEAGYGYSASQKEKYFGFKLHLLSTRLGIPTDFDLTPANVHDLKMIDDLIADYSSLIIIGDKGYLDKEKKEDLVKEDKYLVTPYRKNQHLKNNQVEKRLLRFRKKLETVFSQLKEQMRLAKTQARSLQGLIARVISIIFSFTLGIYTNKLLGRKLLMIKSLLT